MQRPTVSVIIPSWNRKELLKRAIDSVLKQEDVSLEILVCDDGSTDGGVEMVSSWPDSRVRLITGQHSGRPAVPRNRGIKAASGEWIAFLDDDDVWLPGKLHAQIAFAKEKGYKAVTTNALRSKPGEELSDYHTQHIPECCDFKTLLSVNYVITSSVIVESEFFKKVEGFPEDVSLTAYEDYALWLRISSISPFGYINKPYIIYTDLPTQSIRRLNNNEKKTQFKVCCNWISWAKLRGFRRNRLQVTKKMLKIILPGRIIDVLYKFKQYLINYILRKKHNEFPIDKFPNQLHLGCGNVKLPGFCNVDIVSTEATDIIDDISKLEKFPKNYAQEIYACHVLEHFAHAAIHDILRRWYDVLKPGGILRISVPDIDRIVKIYINNWQHFQTPGNTPWIGLIYGGQSSPYDFHKTGFNFCWLKFLLEKTGFHSVAEYPHEPHFAGNVNDASLAHVPFTEFLSLNILCYK